MKLHLSTLKAWAALKPHPSLSRKTALAFRRFAPVTINGVKACVPAKAAVKWARSAGVDSFDFYPDRLSLQAVRGTSRVTFPCPNEMVPLEAAWDAHNTPLCTGGACDAFAHISELRCATLNPQDLI